MDREELIDKMVNASSLVKLICGIGNNAAWMVALKSLDHARKCRRYRGSVKHLFKRCVTLYHDYERRLIYASENRMFHLADMTPNIRKKYGNITDRQYYELWSQTGIEAYTRTMPLLTSLWNKYRLSLIKHHVEDAEHVAWVMTAMAALELAVRLYNEAVTQCQKRLNIQRSLLDKVFGQFSLAGINKTWMEAMKALAPDTDGYDLDDIEARNIEMGLQQLCENWVNTDLMFDSTMAAVEEFGEVFRTKGEQKKAMREIAEVKAEIDI